MSARKKKLKCIMLVDDNYADNYLHSMEIKNINPEVVVIEKLMARDALKYLEWYKNSNYLPDIIFLDLYLPGMDGWEFVEKFSKFDSPLKDVIIIILSSSEHPEDKIKFASNNCQSCVYDFIPKPLTEDKMRVIIEKYFI